MNDKLKKALDGLNDAVRQLDSSLGKLKQALKLLQPCEVVWSGNSNEGEDLTGFHGDKRVDVVLGNGWSAYYDNQRITTHNHETRDEAEDILLAYIDAEK